MKLDRSKVKVTLSVDAREIGLAAGEFPRTIDGKSLGVFNYDHFEADQDKAIYKRSDGTVLFLDFKNCG